MLLSAVIDRRGVAALEFALIAPLMILLYFGLSELSEAVIASRRTNHAASTLGDLISQCSNVSDTDLTNIWAASPDIMAPMPTTGNALTQRVSSVVVNTAGVPQVAWSQTPTGQSSPAAYQTSQTFTLPSNVVSGSGDSVIVAETSYNFSFPINIFNHALTFSDVTYFKPRKSSAVNYTGSGQGGSGTAVSCYSS